jgi:hypothetical protein
VESTEHTESKHLPNTEGQDAVVHKTGTTVAHSVPVRGAANKPTSADRKSDASLYSADACCGSALNPHHHAKSGQGSGDGVPGGGEAAVVLISSLDQIQTNRGVVAHPVRVVFLPGSGPSRRSLARHLQRWNNNNYFLMIDDLTFIG